MRTRMHGTPTGRPDYTHFVGTKLTRLLTAGLCPWTHFLRTPIVESKYHTVLLFINVGTNGCIFIALFTQASLTG